MRAVLVGLLGAALAVGVAQAKACPLGRADLVLEDAKITLPGVAAANAKLIGARLKAGRFVSNMRTVVNVATGDERRVGHDIVELRGKAGAFVVRRDFSIGTNSETAEGWHVGRVPKGSTPRWSSLKRPPSVRVGDIYSSIFTGDLANLSVKVAGCRK